MKRRDVTIKLKKWIAARQDPPRDWQDLLIEHDLDHEFGWDRIRRRELAAPLNLEFEAELVKHETLTPADTADAETIGDLSRLIWGKIQGDAP